MSDEAKPLSEEALAALNAVLDAGGAEERPWCWTWTGDKSNDWVIGTACLASDDSDEPSLLAGHVEDTGDFIALETVCGAENSSYDNADLIVRAVNILPRLLATIDAQKREIDELKARGDGLVESLTEASRMVHAYICPTDGHCAGHLCIVDALVAEEKHRTSGERE